MAGRRGSGDGHAAFVLAPPHFGVLDGPLGEDVAFFQTQDDVSGCLWATGEVFIEAIEEGLFQFGADLTSQAGRWALGDFADVHSAQVDEVV